MQPKELNITVDNGIKTIEVLTGASLEPKEPKKVEYSERSMLPLDGLKSVFPKLTKRKPT